MGQHVRRALISVSDKTGVVDFARRLSDAGIEIISTGGTARTLKEAGVTVRPIEEVTGFPEILDGRVKTLHPAVHAGILYRRDTPAHQEAMRQAGFQSVDLVCVNLYPFAQTVAEGRSVQDCIENIDIGGPAMVRSAAKNHEFVVVVTRPQDYDAVASEIEQSGGMVSLETRRRLAAIAFAHVAAYDAAIAAWMRQYAGETGFPEVLTLSAELQYVCRYGENPHQRGAFYRTSGSREPCVGRARVLHGKELSYNNLCDADAALEAVKDLADRPACVIVKHANPCGAAQAETLAQAFVGAYHGDPISAYGGIVAFSRPVDLETAREMTRQGMFFEVVVAPSYDPEAIEVLETRRKWGANLRILEVGALEGWSAHAEGWYVRHVTGGILVQDRDLKLYNQPDLRVVTDRAPTQEEMDDLLFAWSVVKHVRSNAIVVARSRTVLGVGAGQMNRVQSVRLAIQQAGEKATGAVLASDGFFPFADGPTAAADAGVTAIIQPGGSIRDQESVEACNLRGVAMVFTGMRHFRH